MRSSSARPTRREPSGPENAPRRQTTITARAAILVLALASVIVAVAVPFKIWLGQRGDIASLQSQTRQTEVKLGKLNAQDQRWQQPSYVESQARQRLHYLMPGQQSSIVLGRSAPGARGPAAHHHAVVSTGPWYSQFWQSVQVAGKTPAAKSGHSE